MDKFVFLNGEYVPCEQAHVHIYDHGFLYGDGAFEGIRAYDGRAFKLDQHIDRLYNSLKALWIELSYGREQFAANIVELLKKQPAPRRHGHCLRGAALRRGAGAGSEEHIDAANGRHLYR